MSAKSSSELFVTDTHCTLCISELTMLNERGKFTLQGSTSRRSVSQSSVKNNGTLLVQSIDAKNFAIAVVLPAWETNTSQKTGYYVRL